MLPALADPESFKPNLAYELWCLYEDGYPCMGEVVEALAPLFRRYILRKYKTAYCQDEMLSRTLERCHYLLKNHLVRREIEVGQFVSFMVSIARTECLMALGRSGPQEFDAGHHGTNPPISRLMGPANVLKCKFISDVVREAHLSVLDRLRFSGNLRAACVAYLKSLTEDSKVSVVWIGRRHSLKWKEMEFLRDYVHVLLREALYAIKTSEGVWGLTEEWMETWIVSDS